MVSAVGGGLRSGSPKPGPGDSTMGLICQPPNFLAMEPSSHLGALVSTLVMWGQGGSFYLTRLGPSSKREVLPSRGWGLTSSRTGSGAPSCALLGTDGGCQPC